MRAHRRLRASLVVVCALAGLGLGVGLSRVRDGPTVEAGPLAQMLFTVGLGVVGVVTIVFSLLFGVVQWSASNYSPRLTLFRDDPLVWLTFAFTNGVFVFCFSAGLARGDAGRVSLLVPITAVLAVLAVLALIRALQTRAFRTLQLAQVLAVLTARGRAVIEDVYPLHSSAAAELPPAPAAQPAPRRTVTWAGPQGVVQQLDLRRLVDAATHSDALVVFRVGVGDTLHEASPLADIHRGDLPDQVVRAAVIRDTERSFDQDTLLALRLLADIGLRALSPPDDPATAVDTIDATEGLLRALAVRELRLADVVDHAGVSRVRLVAPTWEDYLRTAVENLLPAAAPVPMVLERMQQLLDDLLELSPAPRHAALIRLREQVQARLAQCRPVPTQDPLPDPPRPREPDRARAGGADRVVPDQP
ncbi:DUF2254 family protein [Kribbella sp. CWNU-51]